jgi:hypothetical protein
MGKARRPDLSGIALARFLGRLLGEEEALDASARGRLLARLEGEIASLRLRRLAVDEMSEPIGQAVATATATEPGSAAGTFDPFDPNVVVMVRTRGPAEARAALARIGRLDRLRRIAEEQRLSIDPEIADPATACAAIVEAAERRIANRRAAAR